MPGFFDKKESKSVILFKSLGFIFCVFSKSS